MSVSLPLLFSAAMGLVLFLFGMRSLEQGIRALGHRTFQRWLSRSTASAAGSIGVGVAVTAIMQSSSLVSLLVLAFASAAVLPLYNAVGVLLGANLGTTVTGWMVATLGFKLSLQEFALPAMALGGFLQLLPMRRSHWAALGAALFGIGLILLGLDLMKEAMGQVAQRWDIGLLQGQSTLVYFLAGVFLAALIQSSSAVMMLTLAALHGGLLDLGAAAALVVGADLGTTSTTVIGSIGGSVIKRQLALAHFSYNVVVDTFALLVMLPLLPWIQGLLSLEDPLYTLVAFHSLFNLVGLLLFVPLLKPWSAWLGRRFSSHEGATLSLQGVPTAVPEAALAAMTRVLQAMRLDAIALALQGFRLQVADLDLPAPLATDLRDSVRQAISEEQRYGLIKERESELLAFAADVQAEPLQLTQASQLDRLTREARALAYSSKTLKDIREHLLTQQHSEQSPVQALYREHRDFVAAAIGAYLRISADLERAAAGELVGEWLARNDQHHDRGNRSVGDMAASDSVTGAALTNMLNVNRDVHHGIKDLLLSLQPAAGGSSA